LAKERTLQTAGMGCRLYERELKVIEEKETSVNRGSLHFFRNLTTLSFIMLSVIMVTFIMLSIIILNSVTLSVTIMIIDTLSVIILSVFTLSLC
jgi:hypothetical protein